MPDISPIRRNRRSASPVRRNQQGVPGRIRFPIRCSINCLEAWCRSEWGNGYVKIIFSYLNKNTLLQDLEGKGVLDFSQPKDLEKRLNECVRIGIRGEMQSDVELWKEKSIREDFGHYLNSQQEETGLCYISGEKGALSKNHPKAIWNLNANAKLISANERTTEDLSFQEDLRHLTRPCRLAMKLPKRFTMR